MTTFSVIASENYRDAVPLCFKALEKFWPDCKMRRELAYTGEAPALKECKVPLNGIFPLGEDQGWIQNLINFLAARKNPHERLLLILEDYLVCDVDRELMRLAEVPFLFSETMAVRVKPTPGPDGVLHGLPEMGPIFFTSPYCVSLQTTIWDPKHLTRLAEGILKVGGKSAWDFELMGSKILAGLNPNVPIYGLTKTGLACKNLYRRSKPVPEVLRWAEENL